MYNCSSGNEHDLLEGDTFYIVTSCALSKLSSLLALA